ncbi:hypothetical protein OH77DRAFT_1438402 [Trametes cingulata]|nr:hypothetical protein OH77DRAFT_1438402 [Trametes cingulata]
MAKDKSEKKDKKKKETKEVTETVQESIQVNEDVEMGDAALVKVQKTVKKEKEEIVIPLEDLSPIAQPLAQKKLLKKLHKTIKKASKQRQVKRGVKEVVKAIRKGEKGLLILAADITPIDIISHLPVMAEDAGIPYVFVPSKEELGHASATKRPTSCVMVCPDQKKKKAAKVQEGDEEKDDDYREMYDESCKESKSAATNGAAKKSQPNTTSGTASPATTTTEIQEVNAVVYGPGKPDKALYDAEQNKIKAEIDAVQLKLTAVKEKIALSSKSGPGNERRNALKAELDAIRGQQGSNKLARGKVLDQLKSLQDGIQKKVKDLNAAKAKIPYKTVAEVDERIRQLERQVESGNLKLVEEKRALQEISQWKRSRRTVEGFQAEQESIEADRAKADELRKQLDDPEAKAISERYDAIKAELDELKKESDEAYASRSKLMDERSALQGQLDELYNRKRESAQRYKEANDRFYAKLNEDRARRAERARAQRAAEEEAKKKEIAERLREEAEIPAFQAQIEDCQTLIDYFSGKSSTATLSSQKPLTEKSEVAGVPKLELRKVEAAPEGVVVRKKKGEDEESYFVGGGKKKGGKKGSAKPSAPAQESNGAEAATSGGQLNVPLPTLTALLSLSIPPPTSTADVPRVIEDLKTKKAWFEANQARVTAENKAKAEAEIRRLLGKPADNIELPPVSDDIAPPNGGAEDPAEPAPTPLSTSLPKTAVPVEPVDQKLESVAEQETEES